MQLLDIIGIACIITGCIIIAVAAMEKTIKETVGQEETLISRIQRSLEPPS